MYIMTHFLEQVVRAMVRYAPFTSSRACRLLDC